MPWRHFVRIFTNNPHLIQRLSETGPIRAAARKTVYWFNEARYKGQDAFEKMKSEQTHSGETGFLQKFKNELKMQLKKEQERMNNQHKPHQNNHQNNEAKPQQRRFLNEFKKELKKGWEENERRRGKP